MNILHQTNLSKQSRFFAAKKQEKPLHPLFFIPPLILKPVLFPIWREFYAFDPPGFSASLMISAKPVIISADLQKSGKLQSGKSVHLNATAMNSKASPTLRCRWVLQVRIDLRMNNQKLIKLIRSSRTPVRVIYGTLSRSVKIANSSQHASCCNRRLTDVQI